MQTAATTNRFLIGYSSKAGFADSEAVVSRCGLLQQIVVSQLARNVSSPEAFPNLTSALIRLAEHAYMLRDLEALQDVSRALMHLPIAGARQIGLYYHALSIHRKGQRLEAQTLLEAVADGGPTTYRARAFQTLGAISNDLGLPDEAARFQLEALKLAPNKDPHGLQTALMAHLEVSHVRGDRGDHKGALAILESLSPLVQVVGRTNPLYFYLYHNELAVEFAEIGRLAEAEAASTIALSSPIAHAYPEWRATRDEIATKRESASPAVVAIIRQPETGASEKARPNHNPLRVASVAIKTPAPRREDSFQRSLVPIAPSRAIAQGGITETILDQVIYCIIPRGPPALS